MLRFIVFWSFHFFFPFRRRAGAPAGRRGARRINRGVLFIYCRQLRMARSSRRRTRLVRGARAPGVDAAPVSKHRRYLLMKGFRYFL